VRLGAGEMWKTVVWKCRGKVEEGDGDRNPVCKYYGKKERESLSRLSVSEFKLATNKTLGYDMPRVLLTMICTARFWIDSSW